jgi:C4-dicarboxylate-binding protein DctP
MKQFAANLGRLLASATLLTSLAWSPLAAQDVTLKMHQFLPAQANVPKHVLEVWADKVEKASGGRIQIDHYPSMQLGGKPPELADQVTDGVVDLIWTVCGYTPGRFPRTEVFELPFMMTNAEATSKAYWDLHEKYMKNQDFREMHIIGVWVHGPGLIHSKKPVMTLADLNGVKLRAPTRVTNMLFKELGATPVGMPVPAVPEALSKGVIDATVIPWEVTGALKVAELVSNHTGFGQASLYTTTFIFAMNKDKYESLPADLKKVIDENSGREMSGWAGRLMQEYDEPSRQIALKRNNNIITLSDAEVNRWRQASQPIIDNWVKEMDGKGMKGTQLLAEARELIEKYSK